MHDEAPCWFCQWADYVVYDTAQPEHSAKTREARHHPACHIAACAGMNARSHRSVKSDVLISYPPPFNILAFLILKLASWFLTPRAFHSTMCSHQVHQPPSLVRHSGGANGCDTSSSRNSPRRRVQTNATLSPLEITESPEVTPSLSNKPVTLLWLQKQFIRRKRTLRLISGPSKCFSAQSVNYPSGNSGTK